jgi:hypothetical protein
MRPPIPVGECRRDASIGAGERGGARFRTQTRTDLPIGKACGRVPGAQVSPLYSSGWASADASRDRSEARELDA